MMDQMLAGLERAAQSAPPPVHLFLLSDHGQSQGRTFLQRFGETLDDVVLDLIGEDANVEAILDSQGGRWGTSGHGGHPAVKGDTRTSALTGRMLQKAGPTMATSAWGATSKKTPRWNRRHRKAPRTSSPRAIWV